MRDAAQPFDADAFGRLIAVADAPPTFQVLASTGSTNDDVMRQLELGAPTPILIVADVQTRGRGRRGDLWSAPPASCLLFSWGCFPNLAADRLPLLSPVVALAICEAVDTATGSATLVKWPNDVYAGGRKLAGILLETRSIRGAAAVTVGIGLNVNVSRAWFDAHDLPNATSLQAELGRAFDRAAVLAAIVTALRRRLVAATADDMAVLQAEFESRDALEGATVTFEHGGRVSRGRVLAIDLVRGLHILVGDMPRWYAAPHVHLLGVEGGTR